MGRAERRRAARDKSGFQYRNGLQTKTQKQFDKEKQQYAEDFNKGTLETLYTVLGLAERQLYGFGETRILRTWRRVDELMGKIYSGEKTIDDYIAELYKETGMEVHFER